MITQTATSVVDVTRERLDEAAHVLARAFEDYPLMRYIFEDSGDEYFHHVRDVMRFTCDARLALGYSLKGVEEDGRIVAVACINHPEEKEWPAALEQSLNKVMDSVGEQAAARLGQFGELVGAHHPQQPHFYLVAIGVEPTSQGKGYGRALLNAVHEMSEAHPVSAGVGLDTETAVNVPLYEHFGYEITGQGKLAEIDVWFFFRPNQEQYDDRNN